MEDRQAETEEPDAETVSGVEGLSETQVRLVQAARWALGRTEPACEGRSFSLDCSGVVSAVYWKAGINLQEAYRHHDYIGGIILAGD